MLLRNGEICDRPCPFRILANSAGIGLDRTRGVTVSEVQFSCGINDM